MRAMDEAGDEAMAGPGAGEGNQSCPGISFSLT